MQLLAVPVVALAFLFCGCGAEPIAQEALQPPVLESEAPEESKPWTLDAPEDPTELFAYRCRYAAENKGFGYDWNESSIETELVGRDKVTAAVRWKLPERPHKNEAATLEVIADSTDLSDEEVFYLATYGFGNGYDFGQRNENLIDLMNSARAESPVARKIDGVWVITSYVPDHEQGAKTLMRWTFQIELPTDLEVTLKPLPTKVRT
ncbi:hypothetical protein [Allorhodopirellula heiligendammensis]|nr:hypothetical protein [Allorhodopirellula heiligendammensis]